MHNLHVGWEVDFHAEFVDEYHELGVQVQDDLLAHVELLKRFGPQLGRPKVDTVQGSGYANMKELRFDGADGVWRFAFAFDPQRRAIVLCGGDKSGVGKKRFYLSFIAKADKRYGKHLLELKNPKRKEAKGQ